MAAILVKKLGAKQIIGDVKKIVKDYIPNDGEKLTLYSIFGVASSIKTGSTTYGEWVAFQGAFEGENYVTGEQFASNQAFIPEPLSSMLLDALSGSETVQFAITVDVKRRDDLAQGYEYLPTPHIKTSENDPLAHLRSTVPTIARPEKLALTAPEVAEVVKETLDKKGVK